MSGIHETHRRAIWILPALLALVLMAALAGTALDAAWAQSAAPAPQHQGGGEANLKIPDLAQVSFGGLTGRVLLQGDLSPAQGPARAPIHARHLGADLRDV